MTDETSFSPVHLPAEIEDPIVSRGGYELHNHLALLYETREEQFATVVPFVREGLERGEQCLYITSENSRDEILTELRAGDVDVDAALESGALLIHTAHETYLRDGMDATEAGLEFLEDVVEKSATEFEGFRVTAERNWLLEHDVDVEQFLALEAFANDQFSDDDCISLCQYNRNQFPPAALDDVIRTHPYLIHENTICPNFYYQPPEEYFSPEQPSREIDRKLQTLTDRTRARATLGETTRYLQSQREIVADSDRPFEEKLQGLLELGCDRLGLDFGAIATVDADGDRFEIEHISGDHEHLEPGIELPLSETYCAATADIEAAASVNDPDDDGFDDIVLYEEYGVQTYLGTFIPVENAPDRTLFFASSAPRPEPFSEIDHSFQDLLGQWVQYELDRQQREPEPGYHSEYTDDVLDAIDDVFYVLDADGNLQQWNDRLREVTGYPESDLASMHALDFFDGADVDAIAGGIADVFETGNARVEADIVTADGETIPYEFVAEKITDPDGDAVLAGIGRDISARVEHRHEHELFRSLLDHASDSVFVIDPKTGRFLDANATACRQLGYSRDELLDLTVPDVQSELADRAAWRSYVEELKSEKEVTFEGYHERKDGSRFPVEINDTYVELDREYVLAVSRDVTECREREQELALFRNLIDQSNDSIFVIDPETGQFLDSNDTASRRLGYDRDELLEMSVPDIGKRFSESTDWESHVEESKAEGGSTFEGVHQRKDGSAIPVEVSTTFVEQDQEYLLAVARDISERKERERFLRELYETTASADLTFEEKIVQMLELGREWFGLDIGYFAAADVETDQFEVIEAVGVRDTIRPGVVGSLSGTYCEEVIDSDQPLSIANAVAEGWEDSPAYDTYGLDAYLGTSLEVNGDLYGTLSFGSETPREDGFTDTDYAFLELMSKWVSYELEREERETELRQTKERFRKIFEHSNDAIFINDPYEDEIIDANPAGLEMLGYDREELLSLGPSACHPDEMEQFQAFVDTVFEGGHGWSDELTCLPKRGSPIPAEMSASTIELHDRDLMLAIVRDITDRKKHERYQRELYEITADSELPFEEKIDRLLELGRERFGLDQGYLARYHQEADVFENEYAVGPSDRDLQEGIPAAQPENEQFCRQTIERDEPLGVTDIRDRGWDDDPLHEENELTSYFGVKIADGSGLYGTLWFGDTSPRERPYTETEDTFLELMGQWVSHELEQRRRETQLAALNEMGRELMNAETIAEIADVAVEHTDGPLQLPISAVVAYDTETGQLAPAAQTPQAEDELPTATLCDGTSGPVWNAFVENETKVVDLTSDDEQFPTSDLTQLIAIPLGQQGILVTATAAAGGLTSSELELIDTTAATIEAASARADREQLLHERETALEEQNETLERLNRINTIIREIDQVLVQASTRAEIEAVVCEKLANVGPYELAWVGTHDPVTDDITPSEWDGAEKGYLDAVQISAGDEPIGRGPAGRAINTRQPQVVNDVLNDSEFEPWRQPALNRGYHSVISLPLEYEDTFYGILVVYASQPNVFDELEQTVLEEMADTIAYAINATESKKALMSDELTELEFSLDTTGTGVLELVRATGCTFSLESLVPQSDGSLRGFFSARGVPAEEVLEYESTLPVADLTVVSERTDGDETVCLFNATLDSESMAETVLDHGGRLSQFNATDGGATATVYLAADAEVREFVEMFQTKFPDATLTAQRTHERDHRTVQEFQSRVLEELTDRQLEVLQTAYFNGYFEEPRNQTASEIADTLGIAQPTFTSHTRVAQRKIFRHLFDEDPLQT